MNGISLIPIGQLILRLTTREEQALFNLEIKKKMRSSINLDIHHSYVFGSEQLIEQCAPSEQWTVLGKFFLRLLSDTYMYIGLPTKDETVMTTKTLLTRRFQS